MVGGKGRGRGVWWEGRERYRGVWWEALLLLVVAESHRGRHHGVGRATQQPWSEFHSAETCDGRQGGRVNICNSVARLLILC